MRYIARADERGIACVLQASLGFWSLMAITQARAAIGRIFNQRCFYLFLVLLGLIIGVPFIEPTPVGRFLVNVSGTLVVIAAVAAVGRTALSFVIALLLAAPAAIFHWLGMTIDDRHDILLSWCFAAGLYTMTLIYLLRYVFERDVMTADRLFGAASAYLLIGVLWGYLYAIVGYLFPGSYGVGGAVTTLATYDYLYFSFTALTSTGFGDITALSRQARSLCVFEQLVGTLYLAILIARLAGIYPPQEETTKGTQ